MKYFLILILCFSIFSYAKKKESEEAFSALRLFTQTLHLIDTYYIDKVSFKKLVRGAIKGVMNELDPYSGYLTKQNYKEFKKSSEGVFQGLGIEISFENNVLVLISPIEGGPAWKAGLLPGDVIESINKKNVKPMNYVDIIKEFKRKRKTLLKVKRNKKTFNIFVKRGRVRVKSVKTEIIDPKIDYIKINSFMKNTSESLEKKIKASIKNNKAGIILDLRNNPGGLLSEATKVSDLFIKNGTIVSVVGKSKELIEADEKIYYKIPLVVLVNSYSASASEIVAAALKDNKRARLVGEKTFGKASVQSLIELPDKSALKLTVSHYYTPKGVSIHKKGVKPHFRIKKAKTKKSDLKTDPYILKALSLLKS